ncbi:FecR domain-containing protein [Ancylomarina sp. DW003]|nr:FecR domain-containing protein [Ancylomarina sp. DW003]MDE5422861.1 FecR domain-containing protein [Ancylomarina sp. DW003]
MKVEDKSIITWVKDYSKGELSDDAKKELKAFLEEGKENRDLFNRYRRLYTNGRALGFANRLDDEKAWKEISRTIKKPKVRKLHLRLPYAAAVIIVAFISTFVLMQEVDEVDFSKDYNFAELVQQGSKEAILTLADGSKVKLEDDVEQIIADHENLKIEKDAANHIKYQAQSGEETKLQYNTIEVPRGGEYSLTLYDGTKIWLNADTKLRYPVKFAEGKRDVYLDGEALFEVAHDKKSPFTVQSHDAKVKVLGTKFNISAYDDQEFIATTLVEGSVEINNLGNTAVLKPGYQSIIIRGENKITVSEVDTYMYTSWVDGIYEFENVELEYIISQLGRAYDVEFFFLEEQYKHIRFTGAFEKENSFEFALDMIERIADVDFAIKGRHILIGKQ